MCGVTKLHNERIRGTMKVGEIAKNVQERKLKLYVWACDEKRGVHYVGRRAMEMKVQRRGKIGRPKRRWLGRVWDDIKEKGRDCRRLSEKKVYGRATWRRTSLYIGHT